MRWLLVALAPAIVGCGLVSSGTALGGPDASVTPPPDGSTASDAAIPMDASGTGDAGPILTCDGGACGTPIPTGWGVVGFSPDPNLACPGALVARRTVEDPTADGDACTCGCALVQAPSCWTGKVQINSGAAFCTFGSTLQNASAGQCNNEGGTLGNVAKVDLLGASGGQCTPQPQVKPAAFKATKGTVCVPSSCEDDVCGVTGPMLRACVASDGVQPTCPMGFSERHVLGDDAKVSCSACSCATKADCTGTLRLYASQNCTGGETTIAAGASCADVPGFISGFASFKYDGSATNARCEPSMVTANATLQGPLTVCCPP